MEWSIVISMEVAMEGILNVENLSKIYTNPAKHLFDKKKSFYAVKDVSFDLFEGESLGLVGESGSGKSTIALMIMDLVKPSQGKIYFQGKELGSLQGEDKKYMKRNIQMVFQDPYASLNPKKTVGWSLREPLTIHKVGTKEEQDERVREVLEVVGLSKDYEDSYPNELSGGQRQRVAIAIALILRPKILIIDEGVSALDVSIQASILNLLLDLQQKYHLTYLFISHDLNVIEYFCDRIAVLYQGQLQEIFDPEDLKKDRRSPYTKKLFQAIEDPLISES